MRAEDILIKARVGLLLDNPFFGMLACGKLLVPDEAIPTIGTNGFEFRYNPDWVESVPPETLTGIMAHETMHIAAGHHRRRGERIPIIWNIACDYAINGIILEAAFSLPEGHLVWTGDPSWNAEQIYDHILQNPEQYGIPAKGEGCEDDQGDPGNCGSVQDAPPEQQTAASEDLEKQEITQARHAAQQRKGDLPAGLNDFVTQVLAKPMSWYAYLAAFIDRNARDDYCFTRPNRRYLATNVIMPSLKSDRLDIVVALDTSGSISTEDLGLFENAVNEILSTLPDVRLAIAYCDAALQKVEEFTSRDLPIKLIPKGRGGTDFCPVFQWAETLNEVKCIVYLTDLDGTFPKGEPSFPVLWVIPASCYISNAPFGEVIRMEK